MSAFNGLKSCEECKDTPVLSWDAGRVYFECACKKMSKPVWQGKGAAEKAREAWNRRVG